MVWYYIDCHFEENISELDAVDKESRYRYLRKKHPYLHIDNIEVI